MDQTAVTEYGFQSYSPSVPGGLAVANATGGPQGGSNPPSEVLQGFGFGHQNPLFWVLVLVLLIGGYMAGGFNLGIKKLGSVSAKLG